MIALLGMVLLPALVVNFLREGDEVMDARFRWAAEWDLLAGIEGQRHRVDAAVQSPRH